MANNKEIIRDEFITIKVSKEEKELWIKYSEDLGLMPTRLARNTLMQEAGKNLIAKGIEKATVKAYLYYLNKTNQNEFLEELKKD